MAVKDYAGDLKTPIVFKKNLFGSSGAGSLDNFQAFCTTRCSMSAKSSVKQNEKKQVGFVNWYEIIVRFQTTLFSNMTGTVICTIGGEDYMIHGFDLTDNTKQFLKITASKMKM